MKIALTIALVLFALVSYVQNQTITRQQQVIREMQTNPACMVGPVAPARSTSATPRRLI